MQVARCFGSGEPSVSGRERIPAGRVAAAEATSVSSGILRPDLYGGTAELDPVEAARAQEYALLAALLAQAPDADLLQRVARLTGDATRLGLAHTALAEAASVYSADQIGREYFELFIGIGRGELLPYGSYYLTGFLHERPLARLRADLWRLGIERSEAQNEPEDHAAILCEIMAGLAAGKFPAAPERQREFFDKHLAPWIGQFFADLEAAKAAGFYRSVGGVGRLFIEIETQAFALAG
jgi:TorA maturation chaperone TorD